MSGEVLVVPMRAALCGSDCPRVSIVVPVYEEEDSIPPLVAEIEAAMDDCAMPFEILIVDDGSRDRTAHVLREQAASHPSLKVLTLARNYGQSTALQAGFDHARGEFIVTLDGDLQNDPSEIPRLLKILLDDPDIDAISGWRFDRQDGAFLRVWPSRIANALISRVTGVALHDYGCALKAYRRDIIDNLRLYGEMHRFIPALAAETGGRVIEVPVGHRARVHGRSKYGLSRTFRVILDLLWITFLMRFLQRPLHAFGGVGLALLLTGGGLLAMLAFEKLVLGEAIGGRPLLLLASLMVLVGVQFIGTGLIGEVLTRIYHEPAGRRQYRLRGAGQPGRQEATAEGD
jgi:glycosyltransferase involved in cell wall biosynthesis